jgi:hypothetical protein
MVFSFGVLLPDKCTNKNMPARKKVCQALPDAANQA